jgi:hypothetical protein
MKLIHRTRFKLAYSSRMIMTRRRFSLLALLAALGVSSSRSLWLSKPASPDDRIVLHQNWILKASDIDL